MAASTVEKAYAEGLYRAAKKAGHAPAVAEELAAFVKALEGDKQLRTFLTTPAIPSAAKRQTLKKTLAGKVSASTLNFLQLLVEKRRQAFLASIHREYVKLLDADQGIVRGQIHQAVSADDTVLGRAEKVLSQSFGRAVHLESRVDPALIGGALVRIGDFLIDGSFKSRLKALERRMSRSSA